MDVFAERLELRQGHLLLIICLLSCCQDRAAAPRARQVCHAARRQEQARDCASDHRPPPENLIVQLAPSDLQHGELIPRRCAVFLERCLLEPPSMNFGGKDFTINVYHHEYSIFRVLQLTVHLRGEGCTAVYLQAIHLDYKPTSNPLIKTGHHQQATVVLSTSSKP